MSLPSIHTHTHTHTHPCITGEKHWETPHVPVRNLLMADDSCAMTEAVCLGGQAPAQKSSFTFNSKKVLSFVLLPVEACGHTPGPSHCAPTAIGFSALYKPTNSRKPENSPWQKWFTKSLLDLKEAGLPSHSWGLEIEIGFLSDERQPVGFESLFLSFFPLQLILQSRLSNLWYDGAHILG